MPSRAIAALLKALVAVVVSSCAVAANSHSTSTAYLEIDTSTAASPTLQFRIALRDLDAMLDLDSDGNSQLTWNEVIDRAADIDALAVSSLFVRAGSAGCSLRFDPPRYVRAADAGYAQLDGAAACSSAGQLTVTYRLFEGVDPSHRVLVTQRGSVEPRILEPGAVITFAASQAVAKAPSGFVGFVWSGIAHIAGGYDHVLFLLCLLLPAVVQRRNRSWVARQSSSAALMAVIWIATAFTVAHSITLALATFDVIRVPARVIEPLIALTIVAAAVNNVWPLVTRRLAAVAFAFGLVHGFGFAEVLVPLALPRDQLALALLGFNLGVELGQLVIVAAAFAMLAMLRKWAGYSRWILAPGSALIAGIAALWFTERVFDITILGF